MWRIWDGTNGENVRATKQFPCIPPPFPCPLHSPCSRLRPHFRTFCRCFLVAVLIPEICMKFNFANRPRVLLYSVPLLHGGVTRWARPTNLHCGERWGTNLGTYSTWKKILASRDRDRADIFSPNVFFPKILRFEWKIQNMTDTSMICSHFDSSPPRGPGKAVVAFISLCFGLPTDCSGYATMSFLFAMEMAEMAGVT